MRIPIVRLQSLGSLFDKDFDDWTAGMASTRTPESHPGPSFDLDLGLSNSPGASNFSIPDLSSVRRTRQKTQVSLQNMLTEILAIPMICSWSWTMLLQQKMVAISHVPTTTGPTFFLVGSIEILINEIVLKSISKDLQKATM